MDAKFQILILPPASFLSMPQRSYLYQGEDGNHNSFPTELLRTLVRGHLCRVLQARAAQGGSGLATALMGTHAHWGGGVTSSSKHTSWPAAALLSPRPMVFLYLTFWSTSVQTSKPCCGSLLVGTGPAALQLGGPGSGQEGDQLSSPLRQYGAVVRPRAPAPAAHLQEVTWANFLTCLCPSVLSCDVGETGVSASLGSCELKSDGVWQKVGAKSMSAGTFVSSPLSLSQL